MYGFSDSSVEFKTLVPFSCLSTLKLGGVCKTIAFPKNESALLSLLMYLDCHALAYRVVGCMSNTLPPDDMYQTLLISTRKLRGFTFLEDSVTVCCGERALNIAKRGMTIGLSALSEIAGIPGTVGAGIRGNAGAFGHAFGDTFLFGTLYDPDTRHSFPVKLSEMNFSYRESILKERNLILLHASFRTFSQSKEEIAKRMDENREKRRRTQPFNQPSLGSVFLKNEKGEPVSFYIDKAGLKGKKAGGVCVSSKHAGFIINQGNGTAKDFKQLILEIQKELKSQFGWIPKCEIEFL